MQLFHRQKNNDTAQSIGIISKYFNVDQENKTVRLPLNYSAEDGLREDKYGSKRTLINDEVLCSDIASVMRSVPAGYTADVDLRFDESLQVSSEEIGEFLTDMITMKVESAAHTVRYKMLIACLLVIFGSVFLWFSYWVDTVRFDMYSEIIAFLYHGILVLIGQAMIMEFILLILPIPNQNVGNTELVLRRTSRISLSDSRGGSYTVEIRRIISSFIDFRIKFIIFSQIYLIFSLLIFNNGLASCSLTISILLGTTPLETKYKVLYLAFLIAYGLLTVICSVSGCFCFARRGRTIDFLRYCAIALVAVFIGFNFLDYFLPIFEDREFLHELVSSSPGVMIADTVNNLLMITYFILTAVFLRMLRADAKNACAQDQLN